YAMPIDEKWDEYVEIFHKRWIEKTGNNLHDQNMQNRDIIRLFARAVHEGFYQANYAGWRAVWVPLPNSNFGNPIIELQLGRTIEEANKIQKNVLQSLHTHFKAELDNFDLNSLDVCIPYNIIESYNPYYVKPQGE
ncbi:MAG: hypothetical protein ACRCTK_00915, partial [Alphaproteobacteria bacterium]